MFFFVLSGLTGLEPATSAVTGRRSNQLNYRPSNMNSMMPYLIRFCNIFLFISRNKSISINTQIVPLAVTDLVNQGIIKLPYFNTIAFQHFFLMFFEVGLLFYAKLKKDYIFSISINRTHCFFIKK